MRLELERRLQDDTLSQKDQTVLQEGLKGHVDQDEVHSVQSTQDKSCPFGFTMEEDGLTLTMPTTPSFHFIAERLVMEENSCSSDMTESSCSSSDLDAGGCLTGSQSLPEVDGGLSRALNICDDNNYSAITSHAGEPLMLQSSHAVTHSTPTDSSGPLTANTFTDNKSRTSGLTDYLDENANQAREFFDDDSLEGFPNTPSPTVDYCSGTYYDLSLSSDSDLEFFDSDCTSGPLHSSFKIHRQPDNFYHLQLINNVNLPQYESSTYLLESLIGLTDPSPEQGHAVSDTQLL